LTPGNSGVNFGGFQVFGSFKKAKIKTRFGLLALRRVGMRDAAALNAIVNETPVSKFLNFPTPVPLSLTKKRIRESLASKSQEWIVAEFEGKAAGSIVLRREPGRSSHVANFGIAFSSASQGTGFAFILMNAVFAFLKKSKIRMLHANVVEDNSRARSFYRKLGFKDCGRIPLFYKRGGKYSDMVVVAKKIY